MPVYRPAPITPDVYAALQQQHGDALLPPQQIGDLEIAVVRPTRVAYKQFRAMQAVDATKADALEVLCRACIVHPPRADVSALFDSWPGVDVTLGGVLLQAVGYGVEASIPKVFRVSQE